MAEQSNPGRKYYIDRIDKLLGSLAYEAKIGSTGNRNDATVISEHIFCGLLNRVCGWNLRNANSPSHPNFPGVDLVDENARVAVQVTLENNVRKVDEMLDQFKKNKLNRKFKQLILLVITMDKPTQAMKEREDGCFYGEDDIWNIPRLMREIEQEQNVDRLKEIAEYLEKEVGTLYSKSEEQPESGDAPAETVQQNPQETQTLPDTPEESGFLRGFWKKVGNVVAAMFQEDDEAEPVSIGTIVLWILGCLMALGILGSLLEGCTPLKAMPEELADYSLNINGQTVHVPTTFEQMRSYGWYCADAEEMQERIPPNTYKESYLPYTAKLTNGYGILTVYYGNASNHTLKAEECIIYGISVELRDFDNSYTGESVNTCKGPVDLTLGKSKWGDPIWPYGKEKTRNSTWITCSYTVDDDHSCEFEFNRKTKILGKIQVVNRDQQAMDELIHTAYETREPAYDSGELARWLGVEMAFQTGDFYLPIGVTAGDYQARGYILDKAPKFVSSGGHEDIFFRLDALNKLSGEVFNPCDQALVSEYCFIGCMDSADIESSDTEFCLSCTVGEQSFSVSRGMTEEDLYQALEHMNIRWRSAGENCITFYPNGNNEKITVTCTFSEEFRFISGIRVDTCEALRDFFVDLALKG